MLGSGNTRFKYGVGSGQQCICYMAHAIYKMQSWADILDFDDGTMHELIAELAGVRTEKQNKLNEWPSKGRPGRILVRERFCS